jgi:sporulation protein YlmC with PRC-barrel domain
VGEINMMFPTKTAATILALIISIPAYAADTTTTGTPTEQMMPDNSMSNDISKGISRIDEEISGTTESIKTFLLGKTAGEELQPVIIPRNRTAKNIIGSPVVNEQGERIASTEDILIDKNGRPSMVVVSGSKLLGPGKKVAAFDYKKVFGQGQGGKVLMTLPQDMISHAVDSSYDPQNWTNVKIIPADSISASRLMKAAVMDNNNKKIADVENIYLKEDAPSQVIIGFNKTLGMGGDIAALDYTDLRMVRKNAKGDLDLQLTPDQTVQIRNFKHSAEK